ncbi:MAG: hypothetical protein KC425_26535 [Anaerolineales bacterium]|nr:hypothetical protein [Anaerolineales bacterium]
MDELVKAIAEQANLPEAQAQKAAEAAVSFLKQRLPAPLASQLDAVLANEQLMDNAGDIISKGLGSLLGGKK